MDFLLLLSGVCAAATAFGHSYLGEKRLIGPLLAAPREGVLNAPAARRVLRGVWHLPSIAWFAMGAATILWAVAGTGHEDAFLLFALIYTASGLWNLWAVRAFHPGWALLFMASGTLVLAR